MCRQTLSFEKILVSSSVYLTFSSVFTAFDHVRCESQLQNKNQSLELLKPRRKDGFSSESLMWEMALSIILKNNSLDSFASKSKISQPIHKTDIRGDLLKVYNDSEIIYSGWTGGLTEAIMNEATNAI